MAGPKSKQELSAYLSLLYHCIEREQVDEPDTIAGLRQKVKELGQRCVECDVEVPRFTPDIVRLFGGV